jgi:hypothetical protein
VAAAEATAKPDIEVPRVVRVSLSRRPKLKVHQQAGLFETVECTTCCGLKNLCNASLT